MRYEPILCRQVRGDRSWSKTARPRGSGISSQAGRRCFVEGRFHVNETPFVGILHGLLELLRNPGIVVFHDELGNLCPLGWRQVFDLLNNFLCVHASNYPQEFTSGKSALHSPRFTADAFVRLRSEPAATTPVQAVRGSGELGFNSGLILAQALDVACRAVAEPAVEL